METLWLWIDKFNSIFSGKLWNLCNLIKINLKINEHFELVFIMKSLWNKIYNLINHHLLNWIIEIARNTPSLQTRITKSIQVTISEEWITCENTTSTCEIWTRSDHQTKPKPAKLSRETSSGKVTKHYYMRIIKFGNDH